MSDLRGGDSMSTHLPHVSERMEAARLEALHAEASDELRRRLGLHLERIDGTMISIVANATVQPL